MSLLSFTESRRGGNWFLLLVKFKIIMELSGRVRAVFAMSPDHRQERELIGLIGPIIRIFCSKYQKISPTAPALPLIDWSRNKNLYLAEIGLGLTVIFIQIIK